MKIREILSENKELEFRMSGNGDDASFLVSKNENGDIILQGFDLDVPYRRIDSGEFVRNGQFDFVYQITGEDEGEMEIIPRITGPSATLEYDDDSAHDSVSEAVWQFKQEYGNRWGIISNELDPEEGGLEVEEDQTGPVGWQRWLKGKLKIEIPSNDGEYYVSAKDGHLILHGVGITTYAWADRDGEGIEGEFDFDYDVTTSEIVDVEYADREDEGYYVYDGDNAFASDIADIVQEFHTKFGDKLNSLFAKVTPEEGGLEVDDDNWFEASIPFAGKKVGHKEGPAGQWRNKGPSAKRPARPGDLVGGGM